MTCGSPRRTPASASPTSPATQPWAIACRSETSRGWNAPSGSGRPAECCCSPSALDVVDARQCGFVLDIADGDELNAKADAIIERLQANAPLTIAATRELLRAARRVGRHGGRGRNRQGLRKPGLPRRRLGLCGKARAALGRGLTARGLGSAGIFRQCPVIAASTPPSLRAQRSNPGATSRGPWIASSQGLLAMTR